MKKAFTLAILLSLLGIGVYLLTQHTGDDQRKSAPQGDYLLSEKLERAYRLESESLIDINAHKQHQVQRISFQAVLNFKVVKRTEERATALLQLSNIRFDSHIPTLNEAMTQLYQKIFIIDLAPDGRIVGRYFKGNDEDYSGLSQLIDMLQCILKPSDVYSLDENISEGIVKANYERLPESPSTIHKHNTDFLFFKEPNYTKNILLSDITYILDKEWLHEVKGKEKSLVTINTENTAVSLNTLKLIQDNRLIDKTLEIWQFQGDIDNLRQRYNKDNDTVSFFKILENKAKRESIKQKGDTIDTLLAGFDPEDPKAFEELADFLRLYPEAAQKLYQAIKNADDKEASALINALEVAGTPPAQHVLTQIAADEGFGHMNQLRAVIALGGIDTPTDESIDFLWQVYHSRETSNQQDLSNTAILSLGIAGPKSSKKLDTLQQIKDEFAQADNDKSKKKVLLLTMQNADAENFESEIFEALNDNSPNVRSAAVKALRGMHSQKALERLLQLFTVDEELSVRRRVIQTLLHLNTTEALMQRARENLFKESDNLVRKGIILYLIKYKDTYPENIKTLTEFRTIEKDARNQRLLIENGF
jgi:hypothetical protein